MRLKRRFDGLLSEGHTKQQLLLLIVILLASFFVFWGISSLFFHSSFNWKEIVALYLDPGVFGNEMGRYDVFRLIITLFGIFVFTALLITVFTNVFSNISDAYKKGERRYKKLKGHTVILGSNKLLLGMLRCLRKEGEKNTILIVTSSPVESLRDKIEAYFGDKKFMNRLTFYFDERDNESNLREARVKYAKEIYIIGENGEVDHDSVSINCCEKLEKLCSDAPHSVHCFLVLENQSSAEIYHYYTGKFSQNTKLLVDVVDINEYVAEQTLLGLNGEGQLSIDGTGVKQDSDKYVHFVVSGFTPMAKAMALTAAHLCHFPNYDSETGKRKTVISFIDSDIKRKRDLFVSEHQNLFLLSHYSDISFDSDGETIIKRHSPDERYGDFLDVSWEFIDADISSPEAKRYLLESVESRRQQLALAICQDTQENNMSAALHLPTPLYDKTKNIPIYVHLWEHGDAITKANETGQFGHIYSFGAGTSADRDPLFKERLKKGMRVNYVYCTMNEQNPQYDEKESIDKWYANKESDKFSSIYCANSLKIKQHSFGDNLTSTGESLCEVEHRRWVMSVLLLGHKAYPLDERKKLKDTVSRERSRYPEKGKRDVLENGERVSPKWEELRGIAKSVFLHIDIDSYENLVDQEEKEKDEVLMVNSDFILGKIDLIRKVHV